jgi:hypothetical protein
VVHTTAEPFVWTATAEDHGRFKIMLLGRGR